MTQALWAFGGAIGSILGGISGVRFGRKNTLLLNNLFIISGIVLQVGLISIDSMFKDFSRNHFIIFSLSHFKSMGFHIREGDYLVGKWLCRRSIICSEPLFSRDFEHDKFL